MASTAVHRLIDAKRAIGFGGFLNLAVMGLVFAVAGRVGPVTVFGAPLYGLGVGGLAALFLYHRYIPRTLGAGVSRVHLVTVGALVVVMFAATLPLLWRMGLPREGVGRTAMLALAIVQATNVFAILALVRGWREAA